MKNRGVCQEYFFWVGSREVVNAAGFSQSRGEAEGRGSVKSREGVKAQHVVCCTVVLFALVFP